jgi:hypothetical protein
VYSRRAAHAKEGFKPDRDIILALTADEELSDSPHDGAHYLLDHYRDLIDSPSTKAGWAPCATASHSA